MSAPPQEARTSRPVVRSRPRNLSAARRGLDTVRQHGAVPLGTSIVATILLVAFFVEMPFDPLSPNAGQSLQPPNGTNWFGTDGSGFDVFSRTIAAAQRDVPLALVGVIVSMLVGVPLGLIAGRKSVVGEWLMRGLELFQAFPLIILAVVIVQVTGNRVENVVLALAIVNVPRFMRLVRAEVLSIRESRFVEAATAMGCSPSRITFRHILPNIPGIILVQSSLAAANGIIVVASLTFIGLGANPPQPSWGAMIQEGSRFIPQGAWWIPIFPGLAILLVVFAFNMIADGLERAFGIGGSK